jgi:nicotinamidase-related amidase
MNDAVKRALILVDFINLFDFEHSEKLATRAVEAAKRTAALKRRTKAAGMPCIYANDNFGHWTSEFSALVQQCLGKGGASGEVARSLQPGPGDYSVLKPRHSAFYETPLEFLLQELKVGSLILAGLSTDMCVSATAQDAYVRQYKLWVPADCVAADTAEHERQALELMQRTLKADIRPSTEVTQLQ